MSLPSTPISIKPSPTERKDGILSQRNLEIATTALARDGLVVVEDLIPHEILDKLNQKMVPDAYELQSRKDSPFNFNKGNIQQDPPLVKEWFFEEVFTNPLLTHLTSTTLGPSPHLRFISANTALPATGTSTPPLPQPTHSDADFPHPFIPFALVINIPLVTMTPANGATEVWLETHSATNVDDQEGQHGERASGRIKRAVLEEWEKQGWARPCQPTVEKGSVVVRDLRLWHGGMPNLGGEEPRVVVALIHFASWYRNEMEVKFAEELRGKVGSREETRGLDVKARFVPEEEVWKGYLNRPFGNAYDFSQVDPVVGLF